MDNVPCQLSFPGVTGAHNIKLPVLLGPAGCGVRYTSALCTCLLLSMPITVLQ
jgi:hypothetical protein